MYLPSAKISLRSEPGPHSRSLENLYEGPTPNASSSTAPLSAAVTSISVYLKFKNGGKNMLDQPVRNMQEFYQAGKALLDIPADENVEFLLNGNHASKFSLDEFACTAALAPWIDVVSKTPKTNIPVFKSGVQPPAPEKNIDRPHPSAVISLAPQQLVHGKTPNAVSSTETAGSDAKSISVYIKCGNVGRYMRAHPVRNMEEFHQAAKALLGIPADKNVEFMVNGNIASKLSLDEFAHMVPTVAFIAAVYKFPKQN